MGKFRQIIWVLLAGMIALAVILLLGVNLYVQSQATQAKIQQELSQRLGTPVHIHRISVTPWAGLKLTGITIPQGADTNAGNFLTAKTFQLRVRFFSLFQKRLVIKEVSLVDPSVVWPQNADGKWRLPGRPEEKIPTAGEQPEAIASTSITPVPAAVATVPQQSPEEAPVSPSRPENMTISIIPEIQRLNIKRGKFVFLDRAGNMMADFQGVDFRSNVRSAASLRGNSRVAKISLRDRFFLERLQSPFSYEPDVLELSNISAQTGGGEITGHFAMQPEAEDSPFTFSVSFKDVQADQIVSNAGGPKGMVQGKLEGNLEASGKTGDPDAMVGAGRISLRDGQVRQYSLLVALGQLLQIEELTQLHFAQAEANYRIASRVVTIDQLVLRSPNIRLSATGTITFNGKLKLESQLAINDKIRGQLFKMIRENFRPADEPGYYALDFQVGGTVGRPKTNLMDRIVGRDLKDLVNSVLGSGKPKKKKAPASATSSEEAAPEATATPSPP